MEYQSCAGRPGTGSNPWAASGRQRASRFTASHEPRTTPNRRTASVAYSEQEGTNLQDPVYMGEKAS